LNVAVSAIRWIEPRRFKCYGRGKNAWIATMPFVEICVAPYIRERIYRLSKQIVGDPLEIVVDGEGIIRATCASRSAFMNLSPFRRVITKRQLRSRIVYVLDAARLVQSW
jgi:hypothetical protein